MPTAQRSILTRQIRLDDAAGPKESAVSRTSLTLMAAAIAAAGAIGGQATVLGQRGGAPGAGAPQGGRGQAPVIDLPAEPTAVTLPAMEKVTGPGAMFN